MINEELKPLAYLIGVLVISNFGVFLKLILDMISKKNDGATAEIKELNKHLQTATLQITRLEIQMQHLNKYLERMGEYEKDLARMGEKLRNLSMNGKD